MIIPKPQSLTLREGVHLLGTHCTIDGPDDAVAAFRRLLSPGTGLAFERSADPVVSISYDEALAAEHHRIEVSPERIAIVAADLAGVVWAIQSLRQLLPVEALSPGAVRTEWELPCVAIEDGPRFGWRGVMIDTCRHFVPLHDLYQLIDQLSLHKYNVLHLHLTEDQGWRFESKKYPRLHEVGGTRPQSQIGPDGKGDGTPHGGFYTQDQLRSIVAHAAERGITVVPEIEFPGHVSALLVAYPELAVPGHAVESVPSAPGIFDDVISTDDASVQFALDVWQEVLDVFPSTFVHIGGDEAPRVQWLESDDSAKLAAERGLFGPDLLQRWFTEHLRDWLAARGRRMIGWDEICDEGTLEDAAAMAWRGPEKGIAAAQAGMDVVMAPTAFTYFDYYPGEGQDEPRSIGSLLTLEKAYSFEPLDGLDQASAQRVMGTQCQVWTEYMPDFRRIEYMLWPRACAHAEVAWSDPAGRDFAEFSGRLDQHLGRLEALGVSYRPKTGPLPYQQGGRGRLQRTPSPW